jgi:hypothetical protein
MEAELLNWAISVLGELKLQNDQVLNNHVKILQKIDQVRDSLKQLDAKFDEQILRDARTGVRHLVDGINSRVGRARDNEFYLARQKFANLVELDSNQVTSGTSGEIDNKFLIGLGYYGNFHYFNLVGDKRSAAIQAYECTARWTEWSYPLFALELFPQKFFSKNYFVLINGITKELVQLQSNGANLGESNSIGNALKAVGAAGIGGATFVSLGIASTVIFIPFLAAAGAAGAAGAGFLMLTNKLGGKSKAPSLSGDSKKQYELLCNSLNKLYTELLNECKERQRILQNMTSDKFLTLGWKSKVLPFTNLIENTLIKANRAIPLQEQLQLRSGVTDLLNAVDRGNINGAELALFNVGNFVRGLSGVTQEVTSLVEQWNNLVEQLNESGLLQSK